MEVSQLELTNTFKALVDSSLYNNTHTLLKEETLEAAKLETTDPAMELNQTSLPPFPATLPSLEKLDCTNNCPHLAEALSLFVLMLLPGLATLEES
jgi:hypothetical protein